MRAVILAAGRGSRMKALTDDRPKCLVPLGGQPLLAWQLDALGRAGITDIGIVTGYRPDALAPWGLTTFHNARWAETNMVSSLECAARWLEEGPCIVSYSDIFYRASAVEGLLACDAPLALTYDPDWRALWTSRFGDPLLAAETFRIDACGRVLEIGNKPTCVDEVQGQYMGLLRFTPESWAACRQLRAAVAPVERDRMHMTGLLQRLIESGRSTVTGIAYTGEWGEVDSEEDLHVYALRGARLP